MANTERNEGSHGPNDAVIEYDGLTFAGITVALAQSPLISTALHAIEGALCPIWQ